MITIPTDKLSIETAEGEVLAVVILRPDLWTQLQQVEPEWFTDWSDQRLWQAAKAAMETNLGFACPNVIRNWLRQKWPDEADGLFERLAGHVDRWVHPAHLQFHLCVLRQNGIRLSCRRWAAVIVQFVDEHRPLAELQAIVTDPPKFGLAVAS
jgi:hypothetical protein